MNSALSTWQLAIMAVIPLTALIGWIAVVFIVARQPRRPQAAAASPVLVVVSGTGEAGTAPEGEPQPVAA